MVKLLFTTFISTFLCTGISAQEVISDEAYSFINQTVSSWQKKNSTSSTKSYLTDEPVFHFIHFTSFRTKADSDFLKSNRHNPNILYYHAFTVADSIEICKKLNHFINSKKTLFARGKLPSDTIISTEKIRATLKSTKSDLSKGWRFVRDELGIKPGFYEISQPIFYNRGNKAIFYHGYLCGCLCGYGQVDVYYKIGGKWINVATLTQWVA